MCVKYFFFLVNYSSRHRRGKNKKGCGGNVFTRLLVFCLKSVKINWLLGTWGWSGKPRTDLNEGVWSCVAIRLQGHCSVLWCSHLKMNQQHPPPKKNRKKEKKTEKKNKNPIFKILPVFVLFLFTNSLLQSESGSSTCIISLCGA